MSDNVEYVNWGQNEEREKILGSKYEKSLNIAYYTGGVTGVRESFKTE